MEKLRKTTPNNIVGVVRVMLGIIFLMTGIMKLTLAEFGEAWSVQLIEAKIPFYEFNYWFVPVLEILLGIILYLGYYARVGALMVVPIMLVATYVHLTVTNPAAFPAQPQEPYAPIMIIIIAIVIMIKGGGKWSMDLKS